MGFYRVPKRTGLFCVAWLTLYSQGIRSLWGYERGTNSFAFLFWFLNTPLTQKRSLIKYLYLHNTPTSTYCRFDFDDPVEMPHKVLINVLLCSHTVNAQIRAQQAFSNDMDPNTHTHNGPQPPKMHTVRMNKHPQIQSCCTQTVRMICPLLLLHHPLTSLPVYESYSSLLIYSSLSCRLVNALWSASCVNQATALSQSPASRKHLYVVILCKPCFKQTVHAVFMVYQSICLLQIKFSRRLAGFRVFVRKN